jgi:parallel beta-helix repeat protein
MPRIPMIIFMALLIWLSPVDGARTYIVDDSGFANYGSIQEAIFAASDGDTICIKPGVYSEAITLNKSLSIEPLIGETDPIILNGGDTLETGITITANGCTLEGLTLRDFIGSAIYVQSNQNTIKENTFENANPAILVKNSNENAIAGNTITNSQGAIAIWENSSGNLISENEIIGCNVSVLVREATNNRILDNKISDSYWGIWLDEAGICEVEGNDIETKYFGILALNSSNSNASMNKVRFGTPAYATTNGITVANSSGIRLMGNEINGGNIGLGISMSENDKLQENSVVGSNYAVYIKDSTSEDLFKNHIEGAEYGIRLDNSGRNSIQQNEINNSAIGIEMATSMKNNISENRLGSMTDTAIQATSSRENSLSSNLITDSYRGIILLESPENLLKDNRFENVDWSLYVEAENREGFNNSIDESNVADSLPIVYLLGQTGNQIRNEEVAHITLAYCDNITIENTTITNDALFLFNSDNCRILDNDISSCFGMRLVECNGSEISGNRLVGNEFSGMFLYASNSNEITANNASHNNQNGISLLSCNQNVIRDNVMDYNAATGIWLNSSSDNQIYENNISNSQTGIQLTISTGNRIYHNNFRDNQEHSLDTEGNNSWDEGNVTGGNYWKGHVAKGNPSQEWPRMIKGGSMLDRHPFQDENGWLLSEKTEIASLNKYPTTIDT